MHIKERSKKFNQSVCHVKIYSLTFEKLVLISGVDGVISIELNIDWTNVSFGLMFIKTKVQNNNSPQILFKKYFHINMIKFRFV